MSILPETALSRVNFVFPASVAVALGTASLDIRSSGDGSNSVWFAPQGTSQFVAGPTMTKAAGDATAIAVPTSAGTYKLFLLAAQGTKLGESAALLRVK